MCVCGQIPNRSGVCVLLTEAAHTCIIEGRVGGAARPAGDILTKETRPEKEETRKCAPPVCIAPRASGTRVYISCAAHLSRVAATGLISLCSFVNR